MTLPSSANVVIIGGGVIGVSVAYRLAEAGVRDVVLLERGSLGSGSTSRAAGGIRAQFSDPVNVRISTRSMAEYRQFATRFDQEIDLRTVGYLFLLTRQEDVAAFERGVAVQNEYGVPSRMVDAKEARRLSPLVETADVLAAAYSPDDGYCTPESVVLGYARAARRRGARLITGCAVTGIQRAGREVRAVETDLGPIATSTVICAAGAWSAAVGDMVGVPLPVLPYRRQLAFTSPIDTDIPVPMTIDFSSALYFRREGRGLLIGLSDPEEQPGFVTRPSETWAAKVADALAVRAPGLLDAGLTGGWAGLYEVTPDHNALVGEAAEVDRFLYATGFSGHGFMQAPAIGEIVTDLVLRREPFIDVASLHAGRFSDERRNVELNYV
ncbi:FAD-binding oxidoreductase [Nocardia sp. NPDC050793]|uniref:NAD(P)/FAD-dependent oxidoreductase n=1 Tax=Nocardia sp. NPDC050793 TaxID=3155159 RepID=UPI0033C722A1